MSKNKLKNSPEAFKEAQALILEAINKKSPEKKLISPEDILSTTSIFDKYWSHQYSGEDLKSAKATYQAQLANFVTDGAEKIYNHQEEIVQIFLILSLAIFLGYITKDSPIIDQSAEILIGLNQAASTSSNKALTTLATSGIQFALAKKSGISALQLIALSLFNNLPTLEIRAQDLAMDGKLLSVLKEEVEALGSLQEAVRLNPGNADYEFYLGQAFLGNGDYKEFLICIQKMVVDVLSHEVKFQDISKYANKFLFKTTTLSVILIGLSLIAFKNHQNFIDKTNIDEANIDKWKKVFENYVEMDGYDLFRIAPEKLTKEDLDELLKILSENQLSLVKQVGKIFLSLEMEGGLDKLLSKDESKITFEKYKNGKESEIKDEDAIELLNSLLNLFKENGIFRLPFENRVSTLFLNLSGNTGDFLNLTEAIKSIRTRHREERPGFNHEEAVSSLNVLLSFMKTKNPLLDIKQLEGEATPKERNEVLCNIFKELTKENSPYQLDCWAEKFEIILEADLESVNQIKDKILEFVHGVIEKNQIPSLSFVDSLPSALKGENVDDQDRKNFIDTQKYFAYISKFLHSESHETTLQNLGSSYGASTSEQSLEEPPILTRALAFLKIIEMRKTMPDEVLGAIKFFQQDFLKAAQAPSATVSVPKSDALDKSSDNLQQ